MPKKNDNFIDDIDSLVANFEDPNAEEDNIDMDLSESDDDNIDTEEDFEFVYEMYDEDNDEDEFLSEFESEAVAVDVIAEELNEDEGPEELVIPESESPSSSSAVPLSDGAPFKQKEPLTFDSFGENSDSLNSKPDSELSDDLSGENKNNNIESGTLDSEYPDDVDDFDSLEYFETSNDTSSENIELEDSFEEKGSDDGETTNKEESVLKGNVGKIKKKTPIFKYFGVIGVIIVVLLGGYYIYNNYENWDLFPTETDDNVADLSNTDLVVEVIVDYESDYNTALFSTAMYKSNKITKDVLIERLLNINYINVETKNDEVNDYITKKQASLDVYINSLSSANDTASIDSAINIFISENNDIIDMYKNVFESYLQKNGYNYTEDSNGNIVILKKGVE